jgi:hypothetical protein
MNNLTLIKQYVDTGAILPQYQLERLNSNLLNTYLRRRVLQSQENIIYTLRAHEINVMPKEMLIKYGKTYPVFHDHTFKDIEPSAMKILVDTKFNELLKQNFESHKYGQRFNILREFLFFSEEQWKIYREKGGLTYPFLNELMKLKFMDKDEQQEVIKQRIRNDVEISDYEWNLLELESFKDVLHEVVNNFMWNSKDIPKKLLPTYIKARIDNGYGIVWDDCNSLGEKELIDSTIKYLIDTKIRDVTANNIGFMSSELRKYYIRKAMELHSRRDPVEIPRVMARFEPKLYNKYLDQIYR